MARLKLMRRSRSLSTPLGGVRRLVSKSFGRTRTSLGGGTDHPLHKHDHQSRQHREQRPEQRPEQPPEQHSEPQHQQEDLWLQQQQVLDDVKEQQEKEKRENEQREEEEKNFFGRYRVLVVPGTIYEEPKTMKPESAQHDDEEGGKIESAFDVTQRQQDPNSNSIVDNQFRITVGKNNSINAAPPRENQPGDDPVDRPRYFVGKGNRAGGGGGRIRSVQRSIGSSGHKSGFSLSSASKDAETTTLFNIGGDTSTTVSTTTTDDEDSLLYSENSSSVGFKHRTLSQRFTLVNHLHHQEKTQQQQPSSVFQSKYGNMSISTGHDTSISMARTGSGNTTRSSATSSSSGSSCTSNTNSNTNNSRYSGTSYDQSEDVLHDHRRRLDKVYTKIERSYMAAAAKARRLKGEERTKTSSSSSSSSSSSLSTDIASHNTSSTTTTTTTTKQEEQKQKLVQFEWEGLRPPGSSSNPSSVVSGYDDDYHYYEVLSKGRTQASTSHYTSEHPVIREIEVVDKAREVYQINDVMQDCNFFFRCASDAAATMAAITDDPDAEEEEEEDDDDSDDDEECERSVVVWNMNGCTATTSGKNDMVDVTTTRRNASSAYANNRIVPRRTVSNPRSISM